MKKLYKLAILTVVGLGMSAVSSFGQLTTFDYSYTFGNGDTATGTLEGTVSGIYVINVTDVTLSINGPNSANGPFADTSVTPVSAGNGETALTSYFGSGGIAVTITPPAVVSFDANFNNFVFGNSSTISGFMMLPNGQNVFNLFGYTGPLAVTALGGVNVDTEGSVQSSWTLTAVPEPTTIIAGASMLLPFGVSALRMLRKSKKA